MKPSILKSLVGKYVTRNQQLAFCHVDRVVVIEDNKAIVSSFVKTFNDKLLHRYLEAHWTTDKYGVHAITQVKTLREDELSGADTEKQ